MSVRYSPEVVPFFRGLEPPLAKIAFLMKSTNLTTPCMAYAFDLSPVVPAFDES